MFANNAEAATTYNIGPGQTYTTFTALVAAITLQPDDIVDGGGNTFTPLANWVGWAMNGSGTDGHPITLRNAIIDGQNSAQICVNTNSKNYLVLSNLTIRNCSYFLISISGSSHIVIEHINISGAGTLRGSSSDHINISNVTVTNNTSSYNHSLEFLAPGTDLNISSTTISGSNGSAIYSTFTSNITLNDVEATGGGSSSYAISITGMTSGTLSLTNVYSGVTRQGVAAGNGSSGTSASGIYLSGINNVLLNADGIYSSNNRASGIFIQSSSLSAGSILKNFVTNNSVASDGIIIAGVSNLTIQSGVTNYNGSNGITAYGSATTNLITEYVTASYNGGDGIDGATQDTEDNCPKNWIVRYSEVSYNGSVGDTASGDGFSIHNTCTANFYYVKAIGNKNTGMAHTGSSGGSIYNSIFINNGSPADAGKQNRAGLYLTTNANPSFTVRNNIISGNYPAELEETAGQNHNDMDYNQYYPNPAYNDHFYTSNNAGSFISWTTYHATRETNSKNENPQFVDISNTNFNLVATSTAIDAGINVSLTRDYIGNPIYGTPDIGAYEYQPPHSLTVATPDTIDTGAGARIYADGKFRDLGTTNSTVAHLKVTPSGGSFTTYDAVTTRPAYLDITNITNWTNSHKTWTEGNAQTSNMVTDHTIGDLNANKYYDISVSEALASNISGINGTTCSNAVCLSNGSGTLSFQYDGGYSTHTFDMVEDTSPTNVGISSITTDSASQLTVTALTATDSGSGLNATPYYFSETSGNTGASSSTDWQTSNIFIDTNLSCGTQYTYKVKVKDANGNESDYSSSVSASTSGCSSGGRLFIPPPVIIPPANPTITPGCNNGTNGFSITTGQSCLGNTGGITTTIPPTFQSQIISYNFGTTTIKFWSKGEAVKELQRFLNQSFNFNLKVDGIYGLKTMALVRQWQKANGLVADGLVGPKTKAKMNLR